MEDLVTWISLASPLLSLATVVYVWLTAGSKKAQADIDAFKKSASDDFQGIRASVDVKCGEIDRKVEDHAMRIQSIEGEMKHLPDVKAFTELRLAVSEIKGEAGKQAEVVNGIARTVHRMENFLLTGSKSAA
ncbi:MAG: hypothetical protein E5V22_24685 [Mesorhizobium sp.]|uniref:hypothetical protein n=1 Tax=Mesorhizobium sp. TaxID=1871066 RepID=UPI000FE9A13F|nr:hypothetical protein [Mesorhizobium sp.]RWE55192.1 MAG: hypothetical protein EOS24_23850 [Mesorhizobium sp.]TIY00301.1 MAG: hypothetical protein E5V22_24685 [Mesorhizobium sp.]